MSQLEERFAAHFGRAAEVVARAPGRLEILGNHTDYNQGFVLSCAVEQHIAVAMAATPGRVCRLKDFRDGSERECGRSSLRRAIIHSGETYEVHHFS